MTKLSFGFPNAVIFNPDVSNNFDNYDHAPTDAAESQTPVEKSAAELYRYSLQIVKNERLPVLNISDGLYDDLKNLSSKSSSALSCGSLDDYLEIVNDIELDELDECLARATAHTSRHTCQVAAEPDIFSLRIVDPADNETSPDWNLSNGCDNFLDIVNEMELDE